MEEGKDYTREKRRLIGGVLRPHSTDKGALLKRRI